MLRVICNIINRFFLNIKFRSKKCKIKSSFVSKDISLGKKVTIGKNAKILSMVNIGDYSYINTQFGNTFIDSNVSIGKFCSVAPNVCIALGNHNASYITTHPFIYDKKYNFVFKDMHKKDDNKKTIIGNDVWIGANANIKRGVSIGNGAIVAMNSVVTKDVPDYAIVAGNPARIIRYRFELAEIEFLNNSKWWDKSENELKTEIEKFYDINLFIKK